MSTRVLRLALCCLAPAVAVLFLGCDEAETSVGNVEQALGPCVTATQGQTQAATIATQTGVFEASWDVTPASGADSGVGLSPLTSPSGWASMATITRFYNGVIDVRDFDQYRADVVMNWTAGSTYKVRTIINVPAKTYSVFVKGPTGNEQTLATNYRFRSEQSGATQLVRSVVHTNTGASGSITACALALSSCVTAAAGATINTAFPSQSGSFSASWDMTPLTSTIDAAVALAPSTSASAWTDLATIVRFAQSPSNLIDARNGDIYQSAVTLPWVVDGNYRVRLAVNTSTTPPTYSIYVTSPGGAEQTLGSSYAFRTEQQSATQLQSWVIKSSTGSARACNFQYTGNVSVSVAPSSASVAPSGNQTFTATVTNASNTDVTWSVDEGASGGSVTSAGVYTAPSTPGTYHVRATSVADPTKYGTATVTVSSVSTYNSVVLADDPVAYWGMTGGASSEADLSGNGRTGTYVNSTPPTSTMPNGDTVVVFNGSNQYLTVPSHASFSIPTTGKLTWEAWIRPTTLQFPNNLNGYVDFMGKCEEYSPTCEWEARMYNTTNPQGRCNRLSAYVFNPSAGLGSGANWQPTCGLLVAGHWYHVVGEYTTLSQPAVCQDTGTYPGSIDIWVNGVKWNQSYHGQTGCMSQFDVIPVANGSSLRIATMTGDAWFQGAIGKVAIYDYLLTQSQITAHYQAMTGQAPSGSCANTCTLTNP